MKRRWLGAIAAAAVVAAGCGNSGGYNGIYAIPLPGGASLGSHPYQVTARFADVGDLVPQSAVMVNDVAVGRVTRIFLPPRSWTANVTMLVNGSVHLPANAIAEISQSSLLGEQFIALSAPPGIAPAGRLAGGAVIPVSRTTSNATVEQVLGALTLLANLNDHKKAIESALDGLKTLSATLAARDRQIGHVLDHLTPGIRVLASQRFAFVGMLDALHKLTGVAVATINASQANAVADLNALAPTLRELANAGQNLPNALQVLLTYPFTNQVLNDVKGDYLNVFLSLRASRGTTIIPTVIPPKKRRH